MRSLKLNVATNSVLAKVWNRRPSSGGSIGDHAQVTTFTFSETPSCTPNEPVLKLNLCHQLQQRPKTDIRLSPGGPLKVPTSVARPSIITAYSMVTILTDNTVSQHQSL